MANEYRRNQDASRFISEEIARLEADRVAANSKNHKLRSKNQVLTIQNQTSKNNNQHCLNMMKELQKNFIEAKGELFAYQKTEQLREAEIERKIANTMKLATDNVCEVKKKAGEVFRFCGKSGLLNLVNEVRGFADEFCGIKTGAAGDMGRSLDSIRSCLDEIPEMFWDELYRVKGQELRQVGDEVADEETMRDDYEYDLESRVAEMEDE